jgi:hypothetical protein
VQEIETPGTRGGAVVSRVVARVRVAPTAGATSQHQESDSDALVRALSAEAASAYVVRRYRFEPSPLVRDARRGWRSGRVREVMAGNFDLFSAGAAESEAGAR